MPEPITQGVVPVAGLGTRLRPLTNLLPKELLPIGRAPLLDYVVEEMRAAGITRALFIVSAIKPQIAAYLGSRVEGGPYPPLQCEYALQTEPKGSGHALLSAEAWVEDRPFAVVFGDCLLESEPPGVPLRRLLQTFEKQDAQGGLLVERVPPEKVSRYGIVAPAEPIPADNEEPFLLKDIVEKPRPEEAPSHLAAAARWAASPALFEAIRRSGPDPRGEWNIPDALRLMIQEGMRVTAVPLKKGEGRCDIGTLEGFLERTVRAALRDPEYGERARKAAREELGL